MLKSSKNTVILLVLLVLITISYLILKKGNTTLDYSESNFAVKDTSLIKQINLSYYSLNKEKESIQLVRENNFWRVNNKYDVRSDKINALLSTIYRVKVREPVHTNATSNIFKYLKENHIRAEIKLSNGDSKVYFVGGEPPVGKGSMMLLDKASKPYITELPGYEGYLKPFYSTNIDEWRDNLIINENPNLINEIKFIHTSNDSTYILKKKNKKWTLNQKEMTDTLYVERWLKSICKIPVQRFLHNEPKHVIDSLRMQPPFIKITIRSNQKENSLNLFSIENNPSSYKGYLAANKELVLIQKMSIDPFLSILGFQHHKLIKKP